MVSHFKCPDDTLSECLSDEFVITGFNELTCLAQSRTAEGAGQHGVVLLQYILIEHFEETYLCSIRPRTFFIACAVSIINQSFRCESLVRRASDNLWGISSKPSPNAYQSLTW